MLKCVVLDYFVNKHLTLSDLPQEYVDSLAHGDMVSYCFDEKNTQKKSVGTVLGYPVEVEERSASFIKKLTPSDNEDFMKQQEYALKIFPLFKTKFKKVFPGSKPITARYNPLMDQLYFYFYSEGRYMFSDFVRELREEIGKSIFLFQVGARDMMRLDPNSKDYVVGSDCGMEIACQGYGPLPSVEMEAIAMQGLEGRDIERLKGRCGKLKCSLLHELGIYRDEIKAFPAKGTKIQCPDSNQNGIVSSYNIITKEVVIKTEEGGVLRVPLSLLKKTIPNVSDAEER